MPSDPRWAGQNSICGLKTLNRKGHAKNLQLSCSPAFPSKFVNADLILWRNHTVQQIFCFRKILSINYVFYSKFVMLMTYLMALLPHHITFFCKLKLEIPEIMLKYRHLH